MNSVTLGLLRTPCGRIKLKTLSSKTRKVPKTVIFPQVKAIHTLSTDYSSLCLIPADYLPRRAVLVVAVLNIGDLTWCKTVLQLPKPHKWLISTVAHNPNQHTHCVRKFQWLHIYHSSPGLNHIFSNIYMLISVPLFSCSHSHTSSPEGVQGIL